MNYRHAFHAGNFADVVKHTIFARLITYLKRKDKAFRVIDTHAGIGLYDLTSEEARRSPEWHDGIARLRRANLDERVATLLAPYLGVVNALNNETLVRYPGSPALMRPQDRLSAIELHPVDAETLSASFAGDHQVRITRLDGWLALGAHVPPKERRGLVLVDPPFEARGEYDRLVDAFAKAHRRFPSGLYGLWYPKKEGAPIARFHDRLVATGVPRILVAEVDVRADATTGLSGCGLILVNPPFTLESELSVLLPELARILAQDASAHHRLFWLAGEA